MVLRPIAKNVMYRNVLDNVEVISKNVAGKIVFEWELSMLILYNQDSSIKQISVVLKIAKRENIILFTVVYKFSYFEEKEVIK